jgi:hypothetical protein
MPGGARQIRRTPATGASFSTLISSIAPGARPGEHQVEEDEAEQHGAVAAIGDGDDVALPHHRHVHEPEGVGHLAGEDEGDRPGEDAEQDREAAEHFQHGRQAHQREQLEPTAAHLRGRKAEHLLRAVRHEAERGNDTENGQRLRLVPVEGFEIHWSFSCWTPRRWAHQETRARGSGFGSTEGLVT